VGQSQAAGSSILNSLLGSKLGGVSDFIASHCGIKSSSAASILGMAAPLVMGTLGKHAASQGLGAAGLGQLLNSQAEHLKDAIPSGLANTLGIGNLLSGTPIPTGTVAPEPAYQHAAHRPSATAQQRPQVGRAANSSGRTRNVGAVPQKP